MAWTGKTDQEVMHPEWPGWLSWNGHHLLVKREDRWIKVLWPEGRMDNMGARASLLPATVVLRGRPASVW